MRVLYVCTVLSSLCQGRQARVGAVKCADGGSAAGRRLTGHLGRHVFPAGSHGAPAGVPCNWVHTHAKRTGGHRSRQLHHFRVPLRALRRGPAHGATPACARPLQSNGARGVSGGERRERRYAPKQLARSSSPRGLLAAWNWRHSPLGASAEGASCSPPFDAVRCDAGKPAQRLLGSPTSRQPGRCGGAPPPVTRAGRRSGTGRQCGRQWQGASGSMRLACGAGAGVQLPGRPRDPPTAYDYPPWP